MRIENEASRELDKYVIGDSPKNKEKDKEKEIKDFIKEETSGDFTKKIVVAMLILFVLFVSVILWNFIKTGMEPTTLIASVTGLFAGEFGLVAWLMKHKRDSVYKEVIYRESRSPNEDFMPFTETKEENIL